ncbi:amino acid permease [Orrella marina]|uniref:Amino acid permease n=1 Tax=Orrella marina TaxID=2163011 RepID=A0A2R4XMZ6_9BURK|nr:amino acid permease [Orrella marina]AWB35177.1 amino acid permease [Orrella marina]
MGQFFQRKALPDPQASTSGGLHRTIGLTSLMLMGVGSTLGTGIFFVLTETAPLAGPAVIISFLVAAFAAGLTALCYAEVASAIPVTGSSYTFTYMTMGRGLALFVGACLVLEWGVAAAAVAVGWSSYLNEALVLLTGHAIPPTFRMSSLQAGPVATDSIHVGNIPAMLVVWMCAAVLLKGSGQSSKLNAVLTTCKIALLLLFVVMVIPVFDTGNFTPFMPSGVSGVSQAAAIVFFSFVGLDSVVNASEETVNPDRNLPKAIIGALAIVTGVYLLVTVASLGAQKVEFFRGQSAGLAEILRQATNTSGGATVLACGAVISIFSVTLIALYGQARVYFAMARDGLLPDRLQKVDPTTGTPRVATVVSALVVTPMAGFVPSHMLWGLVSIGTLMAFIAVSVSLILLRKNHPQLRRGFSVPLYPVTPILSIVCCAYLILSLGVSVHLAFIAWIALTSTVYLVVRKVAARACQEPSTMEPESAPGTPCAQGRIAI